MPDTPPGSAASRLRRRFLRRHYCPWPCQRWTVLEHTHTAAAMQAPTGRN